MISIFNIERFATHDGPGIRTVIFLKGCSLKCPWCANPESWSVNPEILYNKNRCIGCGTCEKVCPNLAISFENGFFQRNRKKCRQCFRCVEECLNSALEQSGNEMDISEVVSEVMKDIDYYEQSGGGVTISGGEPFVQYDSMSELVNALTEKGISIAVETTGNYPQSRLIKLEPMIDFFLFDIKYLDSEKLKLVTGADLGNILHNLEYLSQVCPEKVILRIPVIPGFNFEPEFLAHVFELALKFKIYQIHLLPYHTLGKVKWEQLQKSYYSEQPSLDSKELEIYAKQGRDMGLEVIIGG